MSIGLLGPLFVLFMFVMFMLPDKCFRNNKKKSLSKKARYEQYYLIVIMNLLKRINYLELYQQLESKQITETELERELKNCYEMYVVNIGKFVNKEDLDIILDISSKIYQVMMSMKMSPDGISDSDMANLFSLEREIYYGIEEENNV